MVFITADYIICRYANSMFDCTERTEKIICQKIYTSCNVSVYQPFFLNMGELTMVILSVLGCHRYF